MSGLRERHVSQPEESFPSTPESEPDVGSTATPQIVTTISSYRKTKDGSVSIAPYSREVTHVGVSDVDFSVGDDGALHLQPKGEPNLRPKKPKIKKIVSFQPRLSVFDRENVASASDSFRGFYTLFWLCLFIMALRSFEPSYRQFGRIITLKFARLFSRDALVLAISDGVLVGSTILCVPFMKLVQHGWIRYYYTGLVIQHIAQTLFLFSAVRWTFFRQWYWVQSGFLTLHACTMLMKVHSYLSINGEMSSKMVEKRKLTKMLDKQIEQAGGLAEVRKAAKKRAFAVGAADTTENNGHADALDDGHQLQRPSDGMRRRRSSARGGHERRPAPADMALLMEHPSDEIAELAIQIADLDDDLISTGPQAVHWPANVTVYNFIDYLIIPTLVYELEYPRTKVIRPLYVLEKTVATFGTFSLLYVIVENYVMPITERTDRSIFIDWLDLAAPFMACYCLIFFIIFECILNAFAELGYFADRAFYDAWWNSTSFDEFSRKWNKPVHQFLLRHVYASTMSTYGLNKHSAAFVTFLLSACLHELVMVVVTKKIRLYLFTMQMLQLPMVMLSRMKFLKRHPALGNLVFWIGLMSGFPLLGVLYLRS